MTVSTTTNRVSYTGDGASVAFTVPYLFLANSDIDVYVNGVEVTTGFTTTGAGVGSGTVTFVAAPAVGALILLVRSPDYLQSSALPSNGPFPSTTVERMADKSMLGLQRVADLVGRALTISDGEAAIDMTLPALAARLDRLLAFDATTGLPEASSFTVTQLASVIAAVYASSSGPLDALSFIQAGTGAVTRTAQAKAREEFSVDDFGAAGNGTTDDTAALLAAFTAATAGAIVKLTPGRSYKISSVNFTGKSVILWGFGASIVCTSATGAVYKTDHDNKLTVRGVSFTGVGRAINHQSAPSTTVYDELEVTHCTFSMTAVYGIYCVGTREPRINYCTFKDANAGDGIYFKDCVSPFVFQCIFKGTSYTRRAVYYPGTGNGTDAGLVLRDCEVMGWDKGVEIVGCDWFFIEGCTIDYCNYSIKIAGQDGGILSGNYIGSLGTNPALWLTYDVTAGTPTYCDKITVANNTFTGHYTGGNTYDNVLIDGAVSSDAIKLVGNVFTFYTRYGVNFTMLNTKLSILGNSFNQRATFGVSPIHSSLGASDSGVCIKDNFFTNGATITAMNISAVCQTIDGNIGLILAAASQSAIAVGLSTVTVAHGITGYVPVGADVFISPSNAPAATAQPYLSSIDATNIVINTVSAVATAPAGIAWRIARRKN